MTLHKLSAGDGFLYYTREVASADELRSPDRKLGDYYTVSGHPPGVWGGSGATNLGVSGEVTEDQMELLFGQGLHPLAGQIDPSTGQKIDAKLGQRYKRFNQFDEELTKRINTALGDFTRLKHREPSADERRIIRTKSGGKYFRELHGRNPKSKEELSQFITRQTKKASNAVAGYDMVFSPPKSISYLWGVSTDEARVAIEKAHHAAINDAMGFIENHAAFTRRGRHGVRTEDIDGGLVYTTFRHYDSRDGDPQLHDHVVVSNKVQGMDGKWSALDGTILHKYGVAASEHYNAKVMQYACKNLGLAAVPRQVSGKRPIMEIGGIPLAAIEAASSRRANIKDTLDGLVVEFEQTHGRLPSQRQLIKLSQQATLQTRADKKKGRPLVDLVAAWKTKFSATPLVPTGQAVLDAARDYAQAHQPEFDRVDALDQEQVAQLSKAVIDRLQEDRSTWSVAHVEAETRRQITAEFGCAVVGDEVIWSVKTHALEQLSLKVTPDFPVPPAVPGAMLNPSRYQRPSAVLYTSEEVLEAEHRVLQSAKTEVIPATTNEAFDQVLASYQGQLDPQQVALAREFACSSKLLTAGIGPAGTGKTTSMKLAVAAIHHAGHRVIAVAPTAVAANLLGREVGTEQMTIHALLNDPTGLKPGDVILMDEAGMVGTNLFDGIVDAAAKHGALVRALGDDRQLSAVGAGGILRLLDREEELVRLESVHRFRHTDGSANLEEAAASLALREPPAVGADDPWAYYRSQGRVQAGSMGDMADEVFAAWQKDVNAGQDSLMIAGTNEQVQRLNQKAQAYRVQDGQLDTAQHQAGKNNSTIYVGDVVITKKNDRRLSVHQGKDFVKNNDVWTVERIEGGKLQVRNQAHQGLAVLPPSYVQEHVQLGYALTAHSAQGATFDTAHALLTSATDRSGAYVATSRGRYSNNIYVGLDPTQRPDEVLTGIAARVETGYTAHEAIGREREQARSLDTLGGIYRDLNDQAQTARYESIFASSLGQETATEFIGSEAWGAVLQHLKDAESKNLNLNVLLKDAYNQREFGNAQDPSAVLSWRMERLLEGRVHALETEHRPLREVSTGHLEKLEQRATAENEVLPVPYRATAKELARQEGASAYVNRLYGHHTDEELASRIASTGDQLLRQIPSDPENQEDYLSWSLEKLRAEQQLRETMPEPLRQAEILDRNHELHSSAAKTILERITRELELRELTSPEPVNKHEKNEQNTLGEWFAPINELNDSRIPGPWHEQLTAFRPVLDAEHQRVGAELAVAPPVWLESLGPVPGKPHRAEQWRRLAAEVAAYRGTYNIADSEPELVPKSHLKKSETAQNLRNRAAELHKHSALTKTPALNSQANSEHAVLAENQAVTTLSPTSAEAKLAALRRLSQGNQETTTEQENTVATEPEHETRGKKSTRAAESLLEKLRRNRTEQQNEQKTRTRDEGQRRKGPQGPSLK